MSTSTVLYSTYIHPFKNTVLLLILTQALTSSVSLVWPFYSISLAVFCSQHIP